MRGAELASEYITVRLPKELIEEIDEIIKDRKKGYKTRAEFVKEAVRDKLERSNPL